MARYQFCIIIPFEFHRGLSYQCVEAWAKRQTLDRSQYQIIIAAPLDHPESEIAEIMPLLAAQDQCLRLPYHHDMPLVADAVAQADAEALFFTEAHCLPEPDALEQAAAHFAQHPELAGFSGRSIPVTQNLLSEIEADMYVEDIAKNLQGDGWLKALDQCLVVRAAAYHQSGGLEAEFGHFAEWILAARFHQQDLSLGYCPAVVIHHYYTGDLAELIEFTVDFTQGNLLFQARGASDAAVALFPEIRTLTKHRSRSEGRARIAFRINRIQLKLWYLSLKTKIALRLRRKAWAQRSFMRCMGRSVALGYLKGLQQLRES